jgi:hypothetical protein
MLEDVDEQHHCCVPYGLRVSGPDISPSSVVLAPFVLGVVRIDAHDVLAGARSGESAGEESGASTDIDQSERSHGPATQRMLQDRQLRLVIPVVFRIDEGELFQVHGSGDLRRGEANGGDAANAARDVSPVIREPKPPESRARRYRSARNGLPDLDLS